MNTFVQICVPMLYEAFGGFSYAATGSPTVYTNICYYNVLEPDAQSPAAAVQSVSLASGGSQKEG